MGSRGKTVERAFFRMAFIDPSNEHNWVGYTQAILVFNLAGLILLFCVLLLQGSLHGPILPFSRNRDGGGDRAGAWLCPA